MMPTNQDILNALKAIEVRLDGIELRLTALTCAVDILHQSHMARARQINGLMRSTPRPHELEERDDEDSD